MTEESSATSEAAGVPRPTRSAWDVAELALLQLGLLLLAVYFSLGLVTIRAYSWPLLVGPGPFFPLLCVYRSGGASGWVRAAVAFVVVGSIVHGVMQWFFARELWSRLSAVSWTVVLLGFAGWVLRWHSAHRHAPLPGAPSAF